MFKRLAAALLLRSVARSLGDIAVSLRQQNALLTRLASRYAPVDPPTDRPEVRQDTGVSHLDANEAALALDYSARVQRDTGHVPDDEELLTYLGDEKTQDLRERLTARDREVAELERLRAGREW